MKAHQQTSASHDLVGEVRLARLQLAKAQSQLATAKDRARLARRRRKVAKQAARRAKKQARRAKEKVAAASLALAELEARLARPNPIRNQRRPRRKPAKGIAVASRPPLNGPVTLRSTASVARRKPSAKRAKTRPGLGSAGLPAKSSFVVPRALKMPIVLTPPAAGKATGQIIEEVEETVTGVIQKDFPAEPGALEQLAPPEQSPATPNQSSKPATTNPKETP